MKISVIIPTLNEANNIGALIDFIFLHGKENLAEILVVDGSSTDETISVATAAGATVLRSPGRCRAIQMNYGAKHAQGEILYFVHADVKLIASFAADILENVKSGYDAGCYRYQFDSPRVLLKVLAFFNRFSGIVCRGGDQTLFIRKDVFVKLKGFDEYFVIMEDYDFVKRIQEQYSFRIIPKNIFVSARKYDTNSWWRVQVANATALRMYFRKDPPQQIANTYKKMLKYR